MLAIDDQILINGEIMLRVNQMEDDRLPFAEALRVQVDHFLYGAAVSLSNHLIKASLVFFHKGIEIGLQEVERQFLPEII